ncbi:hypothetical protein CYMTET_3332 [Cymbomonas tetramitiformis]|uniref:Uncharacterized protein n=1 Tax=Cymbomonas tetramitiformis TaxID=36881 RepID=A0AAE0H3Q1_9CHLO|nr:hypothetical protein CYMTET_3332 [Cymbomonas tetramitiformis]
MHCFPDHNLLLPNLICLQHRFQKGTGEDPLAVSFKVGRDSFTEFVQCIAFYFSMLGFIVLYHIELGGKFEHVSDPVKTFNHVLKFAFLGVYEPMRNDQWEQSAGTSAKEGMYSFLFTSLYLFFLNNFLLAIICDQVERHRMHGKRENSIWQDMLIFYQHRMNVTVRGVWPSLEVFANALSLCHHGLTRKQTQERQKAPRVIFDAVMAGTIWNALGIRLGGYDLNVNDLARLLHLVYQSKSAGTRPSHKEPATTLVNHSDGAVTRRDIELFAAAMKKAALGPRSGYRSGSEKEKTPFY